MFTYSLSQDGMLASNHFNRARSSLLGTQKPGIDAALQQLAALQDRVARLEALLLEDNNQTGKLRSHRVLGWVPIGATVDSAHGQCVGFVCSLFIPGDVLQHHP